MNSLKNELNEARSAYRMTNAQLQRAKMHKDKGTIRQLSKTKNRISGRIDQLKSQLEVNTGAEW